MDDKAVSAIKKALSGIEYEKCMLFGSQARGADTPGSDYDIIIVTKRTLSHADKFAIAVSVRKRLAKLLIDADILIRSREEIKDFSALRGSVVRNAMREAVTI